MKTFNTIIIIVLISISTQAAKPLCKMDISGKWLGTLTINESLKLRLGFDIYENDSLVTTYTNQGIQLKKVVLIFHGWEMVFCGQSA